MRHSGVHVCAYLPLIPQIIRLILCISLTFSISIFLCGALCTYERSSVCVWVHVCMDGFYFGSFFDMCVWELRVRMCRCVCFFNVIILIALLTDWLAGLMAGSLAPLCSACVYICESVFSVGVVQSVFYSNVFRICVCMDVFLYSISIWCQAKYEYQATTTAPAAEVLYISRTRELKYRRKGTKSFSSARAITYTFFVSLFLSLSLTIYYIRTNYFHFDQFLFLSRSLCPYPFSCSGVNSRKMYVYITICSSWNHLRHLWLEIREMPNGIFKLPHAHMLVFICFIYIQYVQIQKQRYFLVSSFFVISRKDQSCVVWCMRYACMGMNLTACVFAHAMRRRRRCAIFLFIFFILLRFFSFVRSCKQTQLSFLSSIQLRKFHISLRQVHEMK